MFALGNNWRMSDYIAGFISIDRPKNGFYSVSEKS